MAVERNHRSGSKSPTGAHRLAAAFLLFAATLFALTANSFADITNTATASFEYEGNSLQSAPAVTNVPVAPIITSLSLTKTGTLNAGGNGVADVGDTITYTFDVKNTGNVQVLNSFVLDTLASPGDEIVLSDESVPGDSIDSGIDGTWDTLGPQDTVRFTATYVLTAADLTRGYVDNTASVSGIAVNGRRLRANDTERTTLTTVSSLNLEKVATLNPGSNGRADAGDTISYTFTVTNTGTTTLTNVQVSDPLVNFASLPGRAETLSLMAAAAAGTDPITTASVEPSLLDDPEFLEGQPRFYEYVATRQAALFWPGRSTPQLPVALHATRRLVLLNGDAERLKAGDTVAYYYDIINAGEGPLTRIEVEQPGFVAYGKSMDILAPNTKDSASIIYTRELTAEDISKGFIDAPATVSARSRGQSYRIELADVTPLGEAASLDEIATASISPASVPSLPPGQSAVFTATYTLKQADIDNSPLVNTAEATALNPQNEVVRDADQATTQLAAPSVTLLKVGTLNMGADGEASVGDVLRYAFTIHNTGNQTLSNITLVDPGVTVSGGSIASLAPGATNNTQLYVEHAITQDDIDRGFHENQAEVIAQTPRNGEPVRDFSDPISETEDNVTRVPIAPAPSLSLIKVGTLDLGLDGVATVGDVINYTFRIKNTGNVKLENITVTDPDAVVAGTTLAELAAGAEDTTTFTATYVLKQTDIDAGEFENQATVSADNPEGGEPITDLSDDASETEDDKTVVTIPQTPKVALIKRPATPVFTDTNTNGVTDVGDVVNYVFDVHNTGNVTLANFVLTDNNAVPAPALVVGPLEPGQVLTGGFTATHIITAEDMTAGEVVNRAQVQADAPNSLTASDFSDASELTEDDATIVAIVQRPAIALIKRTVAVNDDDLDGVAEATDNNGVLDPGEVITYAFEIRNTGNVPLTNVTVTDLNPSVTVSGGPISQLDPAETDTTTFTASYPLTAGDIANGQFSNQARVTGIDPDGTPRTDLSDFESFAENRPTKTFLATSAIAVVKQVSSITDVNGNSIIDAGDRINYRFTVTNMGNTILTNVTLSDPGAVGEEALSIASLPVGGIDSTTFTARHTLTAGDIAAGRYANQAVITATSPTGPVSDRSDNNSVAENDETLATWTQTPSIALIKRATVADENNNGRNDAGDKINYSFEVTNTGNVTLTNVTLTDPLFGGALPGSIASLPPGAVDTTTFAAQHVITVADAEAGQVVNSAIVTANYIGGSVSDISDNNDNFGSDYTVIGVSPPLAVLTKTVARSEYRRGERVDYTITASNLNAGPFDLLDIMPTGFDYVTGSATVNGVAVTPIENGNVLTFANHAPDAQGRIIIKLQLVSSATQSTGKFINRARLIHRASGATLANAQVEARIKDEHVFDCGEIIGRVFDDYNGNGYADDGEPGIAGVRLATVNGVLITTDKHGRYHITCADIPNAAIGSNFLLKLDPRTLPSGYRLTTENPRDVRLTRGKIVKLNFGVSKERIVQLELRRDAFQGSGILLKTQWLAGLDRLIALAEQGRGTVTIVYRCGQYAPIADARVAAVKTMLEEKWAAASNKKPLRISTRVECGK